MMSFGRYDRHTDGWFRVGDFPVTTTVAASAMSVVYIFIWAFEPRDRPFTKNLWLTSEGYFDGSNLESGHVLGGQIWRLFTWWIPIDPNIWTVLLIAIFFMFGSQLEATMGRVKYTWFLGSLVVVPAVVAVITDVLGAPGLAFGLRYVEVAVLVAFIAHMPRLRFFFGIPGWVIAVVVPVVEALDILDDRNYLALWLMLAAVGTGLVLIRAMGYAEELQWLPKIPLPASFGGDPYRKANRTRERQQRPGRRGRSHLASVPPPESDALAQREIDALLDKVASQGMDSLSKAERKALEDHSKRLRRRRED